MYLSFVFPVTIRERKFLFWRKSKRFCSKRSLLFDVTRCKDLGSPSFKVLKSRCRLFRVIPVSRIFCWGLPYFYVFIRDDFLEISFKFVGWINCVLNSIFFSSIRTTEPLTPINNKKLLAYYQKIKHERTNCNTNYVPYITPFYKEVKNV